MSYWEVLHDLENKRMIEDGCSVKPEGVKYVMGKLQKKESTDDLITWIRPFTTIPSASLVPHFRAAGDRRLSANHQPSHEWLADSAR
jgi:hypothetical protein